MCVHTLPGFDSRRVSPRRRAAVDVVPSTAPLVMGLFKLIPCSTWSKFSLSSFPNSGSMTRTASPWPKYGVKKVSVKLIKRRKSKKQKLIYKFKILIRNFVLVKISYFFLLLNYCVRYYNLTIIFCSVICSVCSFCGSYRELCEVQKFRNCKFVH